MSQSLTLYRVVKDRRRAKDLSGTGAYRTGGRWNSKGTYMLYTSENSSLAYLESLVHFEKLLFPPHLFVTALEIESSAPLYYLPDNSYPKDWMKPGMIANQKMGNNWMADKKFLAVRVRSAVNSLEYNYLLNPLFPGFANLVKIKEVKEIKTDLRLS